MLKKIKSLVLDSIFPINCAGCGKDDVFLCEDCLKEIIYIKSPFCLKCGRLTKKGQFCPTCRPKTSLTGVMVVAHYEEGLLKEAIHIFKYDFVKELKESLGEILMKFLKSKNLGENVILVPVPLHKKRTNWRGFNQAEFLAKEIEKGLKYKVVNMVKRSKNTVPQIGLSKRERIKNVKGAFRLSKGLDFWQNYLKNNFKTSPKVILVDDVCTTGATLEECAKEIRKLGIREVWGLVLARH